MKLIQINSSNNCVLSSLGPVALRETTGAVVNEDTLMTPLAHTPRNTRYYLDASYTAIQLLILLYID